MVKVKGPWIQDSRIPFLATSLLFQSKTLYLTTLRQIECLNSPSSEKKKTFNAYAIVEDDIHRIVRVKESLPVSRKDSSVCTTSLPFLLICSGSKSHPIRYEVPGSSSIGVGCGSSYAQYLLPSRKWPKTNYIDIHTLGADESFLGGSRQLFCVWIQWPILFCKSWD